MAADLPYDAVLKHTDEVTVLDRRHTMAHDHHGALAFERAQRTRDEVFVRCILETRGLAEHQYRRFGQ